MNRSHLTPGNSKLTYVSGILTMTATMLLSCSKSLMTTMVEDDHSFQTQGTHNDGITILESVPSQEVPNEVLVADTEDRSSTDAYLDNISPSDIASIKRRIGLDNTGSISTTAERHDVITVIQDQKTSAATKIQSVARMHHSKKQLTAARNAATHRGQQLDLIKLSAVGASAFALGGYVNQNLFNQQREREAQTAKYDATVRIRQLEEQLAAAEVNKGLETAVDFYDHTTTALNNNDSKHPPTFLNTSHLYSVSPAWAPLSMSAFLIGGYVAQKVRRSYVSLKGQLETTTENARQLENQLRTSRAEKEAVQTQLENENTERIQAERERQEVEDVLTVVGGLSTRTITNIEAPDENGRTPLILAIQQQNEPLVRMLLHKGANVETAMGNKRGSRVYVDQNGYTAFNAVVDVENLPIFHMLIEAVKEQNAQNALKDHHMALLMADGRTLLCNIVRYIEIHHAAATDPVLRAKLHMMATVLREEFKIHGLV